MKYNMALLIFTMMATGCAATKMEPEYAHLKVTDNEMQSSKWSQLNRFPARYPKQAVINSIEGCATIEYVITPQNEVKNLTVIAATNRLFAKAAENVIKKWHWSALPKNIVTQSVKTQTRFDFCFDQPNQPCASVTPQYSCPSKDIIYSTGMRIKVSS
jgi:periplasmic protein TonB